MSKSDATELDFLRLVFLGTAVPWSAASNWYVSLHSGDPGEVGDQESFEVEYVGYSRVAVPRSAAGWVVDGSGASNKELVTFGLCSSGSATVTHMGLGVSASGPGQVLFSGQLTLPEEVVVGQSPQFAIGSLVFVES